MPGVEDSGRERRSAQRLHSAGGDHRHVRPGGGAAGHGTVSAEGLVVGVGEDGE